MNKEKLSRNLKEWQEWSSGEQVLKVAIDVSKLKHMACFGSSEKMLCRKLMFQNTAEGLERFKRMVQACLEKSSCQEVVVALESTGVYGKALRAQLQNAGYGVVWVNPKWVKHNRQTMKGNGSKTDVTDVHCIFDLLKQGKFFLPVRREPELEAAYRLMKHYEDSRHRASAIRNQLRSLLEQVFPELNARWKKLDGKTALLFLTKNPTPASILKLGRKRFLKRWQGKHGRWGRGYFEAIYELARHSIGLSDEENIFLFEIRLLVTEFQQALGKQQQWFEKARSRVEDRPEYRLALTIKGIGEKVAVGILSSTGRIEDFQWAKQWVSLAGLDLRLKESGESLKKAPKISRQGNPLLRNWLYLGAINVVRFPGPFQELSYRRQEHSPGQGTKKRALVAVADKLSRVLFAMLKSGKAYDPLQDQRTARAYWKIKKVA